jgi:colicin import membrane protein
MMMRWGLALLVWAVCHAANGQGTPPDGQLDRAAQRERIAQSRQQDAAQFNAQEDACYQRFAVNRCLSDLAARRRSAEDALRRQERALDQAQRIERSAQRIRTNEDKLRERQERDAQAVAADSQSPQVTASPSPTKVAAQGAVPAQPLPLPR